MVDTDAIYECPKNCGFVEEFEGCTQEELEYWRTEREEIYCPRCGVTLVEQGAEV
jgi:hypothetical protein